MSDEITKPIEPVEGVEAGDTESIDEVIMEAPTPEPVVETSILEPKVVVESVPINEPIPAPAPVPSLEANPEPILEASPSIPVNTEKPIIEVSELPAVKLPEPVSVGAEPVGEVQTPITIQQEPTSYSSNPKLNSAALAFISYMGRTKETLALANKKRKEQMMKRVYKVMDLFKTHTKIKNDDVEKLIHTDDSTATKYLNILAKENKIKRGGNSHSPYYTKVE